MTYIMVLKVSKFREDQLATFLRYLPKILKGAFCPPPPPSQNRVNLLVYDDVHSFYSSTPNDISGDPKFMFSYKVRDTEQESSSVLQGSLG